MSLLKTIGIVSGTAGILLSSSVAFAEEGSLSPVRVRQDSDRALYATTTKNVRVDAARERMKVSREEAKARMEARREETKEIMRAGHEEAKARIELIREEAKARMEARREEAKQRLSAIRDKAKQQRAEHLAEQFDRLNKRWTDHFIQLLDRYGAILLKIQERADKADASGKDVSSVSVSIQSAQTAIESAREAVVEQAAASYTLDTSSVTATADEAAGDDDQGELLNGLRTAFQDLHKNLFNDLFALRDGAMRDTRDAVHEALQSLSQIPKVDDDEDDDEDEDDEDEGDDASEGSSSQ